MNQELIGTFVEKSKVGDPNTATSRPEQRMTAVRGNGTAVHNFSHKSAAAARSGEKLVPAAGSVSSAMTLTAALRI